MTDVESTTASVITDGKILAVLDLFNARIAAEQRARQEDPSLMQGIGWRDTQLLTVGEEVGTLINIIAKEPGEAADPGDRHLLWLFGHLARRSGSPKRRGRRADGSPRWNSTTTSPTTPARWRSAPALPSMSTSWSATRSS